jgi:hypothetical protein
MPASRANSTGCGVRTAERPERRAARSSRRRSNSVIASASRTVGPFHVTTPSRGARDSLRRVRGPGQRRRHPPNRPTSRRNASAVVGHARRAPAVPLVGRSEAFIVEHELHHADAAAQRGAASEDRRAGHAPRAADDGQLLSRPFVRVGWNRWQRARRPMLRRSGAASSLLDAPSPMSSTASSPQ